MSEFETLGKVMRCMNPASNALWFATYLSASSHLPALGFPKPTLKVGVGQNPLTFFIS
jgi:hypothetical protein